MKLVLSTLASIVVASIAFGQPAEARCFWNGWGWQCWHGPYHHGWWGPHWRHHRDWR